MVFTTEGFFEVAIESWPQWDMNLRPLKYRKHIASQAICFRYLNIVSNTSFHHAGTKLLTSQNYIITSHSSFQKFLP